MRDFYDIQILLSIYEVNIDNTILTKAFSETCRKRNTETLRKEAPKIISSIRHDPQLHQLWESYQEKYSYAKNISYEDVIKSTETLWHKIQ